MPTSSMPTAGAQDRGKGILLFLLMVSNVVLFTAWPWLRGLPLGADRTDPPMKSLHEVSEAGRALNPAGIYRNSVHLSWFFDAVRESRGIFFLGTSETAPEFNLGAQLNDRNPEDPPLIVLPRKGMSPIHSALMFASVEREGLSPPPLVLIINLVYFTESHDVINDGWMGSAVRSPVFTYLNHRNVLEYVSPEVRRLFEKHFSRWTLLRPILMQEYLGNLLYLLAHQAHREPVTDRELPIQRYPFDGILPEYDEERAVHRGYRASDQFAQGRWQVRRVDECRNLQGLSSTIPILRRQNVPALLLILPVNRTFYSFNGMDMQKFDRRYAALREAIANLVEVDRTVLIDLYETPELHLGFEDRMHPDAYGYSQLADFLSASPDYERFLQMVRTYYADSQPRR